MYPFLSKVPGSPWGIVMYSGVFAGEHVAGHDFTWGLVWELPEKRWKMYQEPCVLDTWLLEGELGTLGKLLPSQLRCFPPFPECTMGPVPGPTEVIGRLPIGPDRVKVWLFVHYKSLVVLCGTDF
ncbi:COP9 signalosome complex subunit 7a [Platysternon megacephalum]|uniref:COP9 signalosome complex subunit 7a n=1 Tax=Platysternon megacephalum TaxID=55544 RepID=A0A4D9E2V2_9SAUR|nr:COP9 signalosome complex subunit 7a [Platysternon megacephalum]